jgi:hypothetical protein
MLRAHMLGLWGISISIASIAIECTTHKCYHELDESSSELPLIHTRIKKYMGQPARVSLARVMTSYNSSKLMSHELFTQPYLREVTMH